MKKLLSLLICLLMLCVSANFAQETTGKRTGSNTTDSKKAKHSGAKKKKSQSRKEEKTNSTCQLPISVLDVELSMTEITLSCPAGDKSCSNSKIIEVRTIAIDVEEMKYVYSVSAGKIIGEGANVKWDLSDVKPGSYTITAGISQPIFDGTRWEVLGTPRTKVVVIKE